ncbi:hypothetical protein EIN_497850 [Entamoeba invadens IP1]|uniref:Uncharacterized protein n=1 Tax=Entamoeba invadens IP1 TaxID=370355 RepID=A0A0A1UG83_ENTIV|nr:hypothetical protein EIN_497850 [Entamoeba invadens IP1]ELP94605.1 hypothetical protein EIN_497850 [Entamoeba invadens IP1]|eukprot:XP_004261376.1 hypothetical protein EIN_497850 [Entamoeba invadens IP1]
METNCKSLKKALVGVAHAVERVFSTNKQTGVKNEKADSQPFIVRDTEMDNIIGSLRYMFGNDYKRETYQINDNDYTSLRYMFTDMHLFLKDEAEQEKQDEIDEENSFAFLREMFGGAVVKKDVKVFDDSVIRNMSKLPKPSLHKMKGALVGKTRPE